MINALTSSIFPLNKGDFATSTFAFLFCCKRVATCYCRLAIRKKSYSSWVRGVDCNTRAADCSLGCCCSCHCQDIYGGNSDGDSSNNNNSLYKNKPSSLSELITSYWLKRISQMALTDLWVDDLIIKRLKKAKFRQ